MKKNQLTTTKSTALILGKSKSLMKITKKLLEGKKKELVKKSQDLATHKDITIIGDLMWEKETQERMSWHDGMEYAKNLRLGGYDNWRLPTIEELGEVVTLCGGVFVSPADDNRIEKLDENAVNETYQSNYKAKDFVANHYWSSTTYAGNTSLAWGVHFYNGYQSIGSKSSSYYVRCVRAGQ